MPETNNRKFKILGAGWLGLGGIAFAAAFLALFQIFFTSQEVEGGFWGGSVFVLVLLVLGSIQMVNGLALLRRNPVARPLIAISSLVLLIPSAAGVVASGIGVVPLLVVVPSLWLTLSRRGKEALGSYMARATA